MKGKFIVLVSGTAFYFTSGEKDEAFKIFRGLVENGITRARIYYTRQGRRG